MRFAAGVLLAVMSVAAHAGEGARLSDRESSEYGPMTHQAWGDFHFRTVELARCVRVDRDGAGNDWMARLAASGQDIEFRDLVLALVSTDGAHVEALRSAQTPEERYVFGMNALYQAVRRTHFQTTRNLAVMTYYELPATQGRCVASEAFLKHYRKSLP